MKTKRKSFVWRIALCLGLAASCIQAANAAGFVKLPKNGSTVLVDCNPNNSGTNSQCKVSSLPGESGYQLIAARSAPLIYNDVTVGTLYERVWQNSAKPKLYIFGARVVMNANAWDSSGNAFNVNDLFRKTLPNKKVMIAYYPAGATKALYKAGRTVQGLNEFEGPQPERDNTWVDFRIDANAADPDGLSSAESPWLLTRTRAPTGIVLNALGIRILNSDVADIFDAVDFFTAGYQPDGVPPPEDDDEEEEG